MEDLLLEVENDEEPGKHLIFSVCGVDYGIEIEYVNEIMHIQPITAVPNTPYYVKGIINIRGTIVPVIDMRARFNLEPTEYDVHTCVIWLKRNNVDMGLIVDAVSDVITFSDGDILPPPTRVSDVKGRFLKAIGKFNDEVKQIIDIDKLFVTEKETEKS